jgi:hypothetical protein
MFNLQTHIFTVVLISGLAIASTIPVPAEVSGNQEPFTLPPSNVGRPQTIALTSNSDGAIPNAEGEAGEHIEGCCYNGTYLFGLGMASYRLYRSSDGVTWGKEGLYATATDGTLWAMANGNLLLYDTVHKKIFYSNDQGGTFTEGTISMKADSYFCAWSFAQHDNTLLLCEYGPPTSLGGRYIHRSTDGGATWARVADLADQEPNGYHWHTVAYHAATGRWLAFFGDTLPIRGVTYSTDDGVTWSNLYAAGDFPDQPVAYLDVGDPTRLLVGCDGASCIAWFDVLTGELESIFNFGDSRSNSFYCWTLCKVGDVYYAGNMDTSGTQPVLWVSNDLVNWSVYHKFVGTDRVSGFFAYLGYVGGKLHFQMQSSMSGTFRRFTISPATVINKTGTTLTPATTNLANSVNLSSFETSNTWTGINGLTAERYAEPYDGSYGLRIFGADGVAGARNAYGPYVALGDARTEKRYVLHLYIKATRPVICILRLYSQKYADFYDPYKQSFILADKKWKHFRSYPFTIGPGDNGNFRPYLAAIQGTRGVELFIDCLQIQETPITEWQIGGTPKTADILTETITTPGAWTDCFVVQTMGMEEHYKAGFNLPIKTWKTDMNNYLSLYFSPRDSKFYLQRVVSGVAQVAVGSRSQVWHPSQLIKFALRVDASETTLDIQNGRPIERIHDGPAGGLLNAGLTLVYGDASAGTVFPGHYFDWTMANSVEVGFGFVPFRMQDREVAAAFNLTPIVPPHGDMQTFRILAEHWFQTLCSGPDWCGSADRNCDGTVDIQDLIDLADVWLR